MRFMVLVKSDARSESGALPDEQLLAAMAGFNEKAVKAGTMLGGDGLKPSASGVRVRYDNGKISVTDGPFAEAKELVGGFWIVRAGSLKEATDWAQRAPFEEGEVEIRQLEEIEDFPIDPSEQAGGWREKETAAREAAGTWPKFEAAPGKHRFIGFVKGDRDTEAGVPPSPELLENMAEAIELGKQFVQVDGPHRLNKVSTLEIRELFELSDFEPGAAVDRHAKLHAELAKK